MGIGTAALIVAAGRGARLGADLPKQYLPLGDGTVLARAIQRFLDLPEITAVQVVIGAADAVLYNRAVSPISDPRLLPPVVGGDTRTTSVRNGLGALAELDPARVLIHDAARPFVPHQVIRNVIDALDDSDGAFAALPVVDALWQASGQQAETPVDRDGLWRAQTPQGFRFDAIVSAYAAHRGAAADDVEIARNAGLDVWIVMGDEAGFKITTEADLVRARQMVAARDAK